MNGSGGAGDDLILDSSQKLRGVERVRPGLLGQDRGCSRSQLCRLQEGPYALPTLSPMAKDAACSLPCAQLC